MALLSFLRPRPAAAGTPPGVARDLLEGVSIEVMPRTAAKVADFRALLPRGTRVYVAHLDGTPIDDMVATARRLTDEGFRAMPHVPARLVADRAMLATWLSRYRDEAGVDQALVLAGGIARPHGAFASSMDLLGTGLFDRHGFTRLHVAGHPEGNRDIDPDGGSRAVDAALAWKQDLARRSGADMAIVTQFAFDAAPVIAWAGRLRAAGIGLPIHLGVAGPAKLQTLIRFAVACGVGPSLRVLERRALDMRKLLLPYTPDELLAAIGAWRARTPDCPVAAIHLFPLGGIAATAEWLAARGAAGAPAVAQA
ncbi:MAG: methylenetetrahydrofolate reductase [Rhodobacteraceae bacterium]|nr:methylenetetrahydrofolate reductase [Paracoccaceae bacterium]